jgi:uncharacterized protein
MQIKKWMFGLAMGLLTVSVLQAKPKKEKPTWEQRKARFKEPSGEAAKKINDSLPKELSAKPKQERRVLVFYRCEGFVHSSIPTGNYTLKRMGENTGAFTTDFTDAYTDLSAENLKQYDLLLFNNTTRLKMPEENRSAILAFIRSGKGIAGIHAASDNFADWKEGAELVGGVFNGHPWTSKGEWAFKNDEPKHVLNQGFKGEGFCCKDEIYCYKKPVDRDAVRVLVSLDMTKQVNLDRVKDVKMVKQKFGVDDAKLIDNPVSWCRAYGQGRLFYTNFGHNESTFSNAAIMKHLLDGIQYALGDLSAPDAALAKADRSAPVLAPVK